MESDTCEQQECPLSRERVDDGLYSSDTRSTDFTSHKIVDCGRARTSPRVEINDQGAVDGEDGRGAVSDEELQDDRNREAGVEREAVRGCADNEQRGDPPGVAHAGDLDGEVGMSLGGYAGIDGQAVLHAVLALGDFVVVVHQVADCI